MDADRSVDPEGLGADSSADAPAAKPPRPSPAAAVLGAFLTPAHYDPSAQHQYVAMRGAAAVPNVDAEFDSILGASKPAGPAGVAGASGAEGAAPGAVEGAAGAVANALPEPPQPLAQRIVNGAKAVAMDVGKGILHAPGQIVGGVLDYGNNL